MHINVSRNVFVPSLFLIAIMLFVGCGQKSNALPATSKGWLGIPSAVNEVVTMIHDGTGWLINKSDVSIELQGEIVENSGVFTGDYRITVEYGNEKFETVASKVPCDEFGIPTEQSTEKLRGAVEKIKERMKRFQD